MTGDVTEILSPVNTWGELQCGIVDRVEVMFLGCGGRIVNEYGDMA